MEPDVKRPDKFVEPEPAASKFPLTHLMLRYDWHRDVAEALWDADKPTRGLIISAQGVPLFDIDSLPPRRWTRLPEASTSAMHSHLTRSSFVTVTEGDGEPLTTLIQEDGMEDKPSL